MIEKKRLTAIKARIGSVMNGRYVNEAENSYIVTKKAYRINRVRLLGTVVDRFLSADKKFSSITLDDGTDTIRAKIFDSIVLDNLNAGEIVDLVGKIREYNGEIYVLIENVWKMADPNFEILRELEIRENDKAMDSKKKIIIEYKKQISDLHELKHVMKEFGISSHEIEAVIQAESIEEPEHDIGTEEQKEKILMLIDQMDSGEGCNYSEIIEKSGLPENVVDIVIEELLNEGSCYEPKPGKIKKL
ncbi:MAG: OB-fold nucleic acid binding domain-containing protein [Candidatus Aenigmarchaeota archaeon]|nr:OB-fold nucleic acid binding domain-containing protein [Candidatus Aenigmarchaeota archaeon]